MLNEKDLKSKQDYRDFLEEAYLFFEKDKERFYSAITLLDLFKEEVVKNVF